MVLPREQGQVLFTLERVISSAVYIEHRFLWSFFCWIRVHWLEKLKYLFLFLLCFSLVDIWMLQAVHFCSFIWLINLFTAIIKWQTKSNRLIINLTYCKSPTMTNCIWTLFFCKHTLHEAEIQTKMRNYQKMWTLHWHQACFHRSIIKFGNCTQ